MNNLNIIEKSNAEGWREKKRGHTYYNIAMCAECGGKIDGRIRSIEGVEYCSKCYPGIVRLIDIKNRREAEYKKYRKVEK